MDTGADCIARDIKAIVETRLAMAEKLGALEQHVGITMQHARTTMTEVADKTTSIVRETIHVAKAAIDPSVHAARHPWVFVGGALVLGYAVGTIYRRGRRISNGGGSLLPPRREGCCGHAHERLPIVRRAGIRGVSLLFPPSGGEWERET